MLQAKWPSLLLFVATLLTASCQRTENATEQGKWSVMNVGLQELGALSKRNNLGCLFCFLLKGGEHIGTDKLEIFDFTFNSTNMTHFAYGVAANAVAILLYGSTFVPVKRIETGDGKHKHDQELLNTSITTS